MAGTLAGFLSRDYTTGGANCITTWLSCRRQHALETFAQALRAIGEPIFGRSAREISIAQLLGNCSRPPAASTCRPQPALVLLQKTMVVVERVARGLDPDFDIWASRPVAERWVTDNMGPEARLARAAEGFGPGQAGR